MTFVCSTWVSSAARQRLTAVAITLVTAVAFLPVIGNGWVQRDDPDNFLNNTGYRGLGPAQLRWAFSTFQLGVYQPLAWVLLGAQYEVCGLSPWGYHLASLILHCVNAAVLMALAVAILRRCKFMDGAGAGDNTSLYFGAAWAAALYAVHPLRVEVVAWASCQPYLPCTMFAMVSVIAYLRREGASGAGRVGWLGASCAMYVLALLCKAAALTLPGVLLLLDAYPLRRFSGAGRSLRRAVLAAVLDKAPFAAVGMFFFAVAWGG